MIEQWREWWVPGLHKHEDQVGGMVWKLKGLTFASVKGAGHMVPKDKPKEAYVLFNAFINNQDLPYNSNWLDINKKYLHFLFIIFLDYKQINNKDKYEHIVQ